MSAMMHPASVFAGCVHALPVHLQTRDWYFQPPRGLFSFCTNARQADLEGACWGRACTAPSLLLEVSGCQHAMVTGPPHTPSRPSNYNRILCLVQGVRV